MVRRSSTWKWPGGRTSRYPALSRVPPLLPTTGQSKVSWLTVPLTKWPGGRTSRYPALSRVPPLLPTTGQSKVSWLQGWEFVHSLIYAHPSFAHRSFAQIAQIKWAIVSDSLRLLRTNEWLWANFSGCSCQKSNSERFGQVAHDNWANEQIAFFYQIAHSLFRSQKTSNLL